MVRTHIAKGTYDQTTKEGKPKAVKEASGERTSGERTGGEGTAAEGIGDKIRG